MTLWVLDKSAHIRLIDGISPPPEIDLADLVMCEIGELEWLYSARSAADYERQRSSIREAFPVLQAPPDIFERVRRAATRPRTPSRHVAPHRHLDLVIAETALAHNAGVLHHDRDYARIAKVRPDLLERQLT